MRTTNGESEKLQSCGEFTQIYEAAKRRLAQGHCQKNFPVMTTPPHKEIIKKNDMGRN
jgi:hypothetical protein